MSEKPKTLEELQKEYNQLCFRAGSLQYEIMLKQKDLTSLNDSLRKINLEAAMLETSKPKQEEQESKSNES